jgi:hypothetical protein
MAKPRSTSSEFRFWFYVILLVIAQCKLSEYYDDSLEGKMAADPLKNKKMLNKRENIFLVCIFHLM